jgi:hypothetical protein
VALPVPLTTFLRRISRGNGQAAALVLQWHKDIRADTQSLGSAGSPLRSDQLGCPQMGEPELELAVVELLGARFGCLRVLEGRCLLSVAIHRLEAVE